MYHNEWLNKDSNHWKLQENIENIRGLKQRVEYWNKMQFSKKKMKQSVKLRKKIFKICCLSLETWNLIINEISI